MPGYEVEIDGVDGKWDIDADDDAALQRAVDQIKQQHGAAAAPPPANIKPNPVRQGIIDQMQAGGYKKAADLYNQEPGELTAGRAAVENPEDEFSKLKFQPVQPQGVEPNRELSRDYGLQKTWHFQTGTTVTAQDPLRENGDPAKKTAMTALKDQHVQKLSQLPADEIQKVAAVPNAFLGHDIGEQPQTESSGSPLGRGYEKYMSVMNLAHQPEWNPEENPFETAARAFPRMTAGLVAPTPGETKGEAATMLLPRALATAGSVLTDPVFLALGGTGELAQVATKLPQLARVAKAANVANKAVINPYFGYEMGKGAIQQGKGIYDALSNGDTVGALQQLPEAAVNAYFLAHSAKDMGRSIADARTNAKLKSQGSVPLEPHEAQAVQDAMPPQNRPENMTMTPGEFQEQALPQALDAQPAIKEAVRKRAQDVLLKRVKNMVPDAKVEANPDDPNSFNITHRDGTQTKVQFVNEMDFDPQTAWKNQPEEVAKAVQRVTGKQLDPKAPFEAVADTLNQPKVIDFFRKQGATGQFVVGENGAPGTVNLLQSVDLLQGKNGQLYAQLGADVGTVNHELFHRLVASGAIPKDVWEGWRKKFAPGERDPGVIEDKIASNIESIPGGAWDRVKSRLRRLNYVGMGAEALGKQKPEKTLKLAAAGGLEPKAQEAPKATGESQISPNTEMAEQAIGATPAAQPGAKEGYYNPKTWTPPEDAGKPVEPPKAPKPPEPAPQTYTKNGITGMIIGERNGMAAVQYPDGRTELVSKDTVQKQHEAAGKVKVGDSVTFTDDKGNQQTGRLKQVNGKTAMVESNGQVLLADAEKLERAQAGPPVPTEAQKAQADEAVAERQTEEQKQKNEAEREQGQQAVGDLLQQKNALGTILGEQQPYVEPGLPNPAEVREQQGPETPAPDTLAARDAALAQREAEARAKEEEAANQAKAQQAAAANEKTVRESTASDLLRALADRMESQAAPPPAPRQKVAEDLLAGLSPEERAKAEAEQLATLTAQRAEEAKRLAEQERQGGQAAVGEMTAGQRVLSEAAGEKPLEPGLPNPAKPRGPDRRAQDLAVEFDRRGQTDRRVFDEHPDNLSPEEQRVRLLTADTTRLPNKSAWKSEINTEDVGKTHQTVGGADLDDFKALNSKYGYAAVDKGVLQEVGRIIREEMLGAKGDVLAANEKGDEFLSRAVSPEAHDTFWNKVRDRLAKTRFVVKNKDGGHDIIEGIGLSHGKLKEPISGVATEDHLKRLEGEIKLDKDARKAAGLRTGTRDLQPAAAGAGVPAGPVEAAGGRRGRTARGPRAGRDNPEAGVATGTEPLKPAAETTYAPGEKVMVRRFDAKGGQQEATVVGPSEKFPSRTVVKTADGKMYTLKPNEIFGKAGGETKYQIKAPDTPEFKKWFGDSKVVDEEGRPLPLYHGTPTPGFHEFDKSKFDPNGLYGPGIYMTESPEVAGGRVGDVVKQHGFDTEQAAQQYAKKDWRLTPFYDNVLGKWMVYEDAKGIDRGGYSHAGQFRDLPQDERQAIADAIQDSPEFRRKIKTKYWTAGEYDFVHRVLDEFDRGIYRDISILEEQPYNLPVQRILSDAGLARAGGVHPLFARIENPFPIDRQFRQRDAAMLLDKLSPSIGDDALRYVSRELANDASSGDTITGGRIYDLLSMKMPKDAINKALASAGYDGITHIGGDRVGWTNHRVHIAFDPSQVKSAFNSRPTESPDMRYQIKGPKESPYYLKEVPEELKRESIEDPTSRAMPVQSEEARKLVSAQRTVTEEHGGHGPIHDVEFYQDAMKRLKRDRAGELTRLVNRANDGAGPETPSDVAIAKELLDELATKAIKTGDQKSIEDATKASWAFDEAGSQGGRFLRAFREMFRLDPVNRAKTILNGAIFSPSESLRKKLAKGDPDARAEAAKQAKKAIEALKKAGIDISTWKDEDFKDRRKVANAVRIASTAKSSFWDKLYEWRMFNLLSGPKTAARNTASNVLYSVWSHGIQELGETALKSAFRKGDKMEPWREYASAWKAAMTAYGEASRNFVETVATEIPNFESSHGGTGATQYDTFKPAIGGWFGKNVVRKPMTLLMAADEWIKTLNGHYQAAASARQIARREGLRPGTDEFDGRVRELQTDPLSEAWMTATKRAEELAFQEDLRGNRDVLSKVGSWIMQGKRTVPGLRHLLPFVKVPINLTRKGIQMTGLPLDLGNFIEVRRMIQRGELGQNLTGDTAGGDRLARAIVQQALGIGIGYAIIGGLLDDENGSRFTGTAPYGKSTNRGEPVARRNAEPPSSIRFGKDTYADISGMEPFGTAEALLADVQAARRDNDVRGLSRISQFILDHVVGQITQKSSLKGLSDVLEVLKDSSQAGDYAVNLAHTFLLPNLIKDPLRSLDPYIREQRVWGATGANERGEGELSRGARRLGYKTLPAESLAPPAKSDLLLGDLKKGTTNPLVRVFSPIQINSPSEASGDPDAVAFYKKLIRYGETHPEEEREYFPVQPSPVLTIRDKGQQVRVQLSDEEAHELGELTHQNFARMLKGQSFYKSSQPLTKQNIDLLKRIRQEAGNIARIRMIGKYRKQLLE